ncbi:hypothetical protein [Rothia sp. P4278]|uniref:hypothetical protein n=1 Tax=Rothia sp. P4278 TaxID=3402658 RepID=UPI003AE01470
MLWESLDHSLPSHEEENAEGPAAPATSSHDQENLYQRWVALGKELQGRLATELGENYTVETIYRLDTTEDLGDLLSR